MGATGFVGGGEVMAFPIRVSFPKGENEMARRRHQRKGHLREENGSWLLTYRVYVAGSDKPKRPTINIGPSVGPGAFTKRQAERIAWDHYLKPLDDRVQRPISTITVDQYWTNTYQPWLKAFKKKSTQNQYISLYQRWIKPAIGDERFHDLTADSIEAVVARALAAGMSTWTAKHVRKVCGAIFAKAKKSKVASGENPAWESERIKPQEKRARTSLNPDQFCALLDLLPSAAKVWSQPYREMAYTAAITSMNAAELCGLKWECVNFSGDYVTVDNVSIPPRSMAVLWHWKHSEYTSVKTDNRERVIPMPDELCQVLAGLKATTERSAPADPVFASRAGTPVDADNVRSRYFQPAAEKLKLGRIGWHSFRRTNATMTDAVSMSIHDRMKILGHGSIAMTNHYTSRDLERARTGLGEMARKLTRKETVQ